MKNTSLFTSALLLSACTAIPVKTLYKLATTDPMSVDPKVIRTAARMPDWIEPRVNGAKLEITAQTESAEPSKETFILQAVPLVLEQKDLELEAKPGFNIYVYRVNPADIPRLEAFRDSIKAKKAAGIKIKGSMGASVDACYKGELREGEILVSNYLRLEAESGYLPVVVDYNLRKELDGKNLAELLPPC